jgi:hypothetical protein
MTHTYIGIDNGVSGSIGILQPEIGTVKFLHTPARRELNYTKAKSWFTRIDIEGLFAILRPYVESAPFVCLERPMVNPGRFKATVSALRAMEATLIVIELLKIPYEYIDSKAWQKSLLPKQLKREELKEASLEVGKRLFPSVDFAGFLDADGLLIAEWTRREKSCEL